MPAWRACTKAARNGLPSGPVTVPVTVAASAIGQASIAVARTEVASRKERTDDRMTFLAFDVGAVLIAPSLQDGLRVNIGRGSDVHDTHHGHSTSKRQ